ncbi:MAG TPA: hypothetical protein VNY08_14150 [Bradyrhizobium sp.]|jgi:hypothetical protein|nr:hypothetical protein [Bradyrhizobium sp.]
MSSRLTKQARMGKHEQMMKAFTAFIDKHWPLWRQHAHGTRYNDLLEAFKAGWRAA